MHRARVPGGEVDVPQDRAARVDQAEVACREEGVVRGDVAVVIEVGGEDRGGVRDREEEVGAVVGGEGEGGGGVDCCEP